MVCDWAAAQQPGQFGDVALLRSSMCGGPSGGPPQVPACAALATSPSALWRSAGPWRGRRRLRCARVRPVPTRRRKQVGGLQRSQGVQALDQPVAGPGAATGHPSAAPELRRQRGDRRAQDLQVVGGGVGLSRSPAAAWPLTARRVVAPAAQRRRPMPLKLGSAPYFFLNGTTHSGV